MGVDLQELINLLEAARGRGPRRRTEVAIFLTQIDFGANHPAPRVINTDGRAAYPPAVAQLKAEGNLAEDCRHRPVPLFE